MDGSGKLVYAHSDRGDRIADYSFAGYKGGGVALPTVAAKRTVTPSGQDDTAAIQHAIEEVSALPLTDGFRGAVELAPGVYHCAKPLTIAASGVVLRGAGAGPQGTSIVMTGDPHLGIDLRGELQVQPQGKPTIIADAYVPSGATSFQVADASGLHAGDTVEIVKPVTPEWVHFMGMDTLARNGKPEHWVQGDLRVRRRIASVTGKTVTLDIALLDSYDQKFLGPGSATVTKVAVSGQIAGVGVESLKFVAPGRSVELSAPQFDGLKMENAVDSWVRDLAFEETSNSVDIAAGTERVTVAGVNAVKKVPIVGGPKSFMFSTNGSQILFHRCTGTGDNIFYFATQSRQQGPVVVLHCRFQGDGHMQPHQRWSTGLLIDNCEAPGGGIDLMNRGEMGSGHGWAIGWAIVWNSTAKTFEINHPPGVANWSIGNRGEEVNPPMPVFDGSNRAPLLPGIVESPGKPVLPGSLYLAQLEQRLGRDAVKNLGDQAVGAR
jgi:hypothetical protein